MKNGIAYSNASSSDETTENEAKDNSRGGFKSSSSNDTVRSGERKLKNNRRGRTIGQNGLSTYSIGLDISSFGNAIAAILYILILNNSYTKSGTEKKTPDATDLKAIFSTLHSIEISIKDYVNRMLTYSNAVEEVFIYALVYLVKLQIKDRELGLSVWNVHRLFSSAVLASIKVVQNEMYTIDYYAKCFGIKSEKELVKMEAAFRKFSQFDGSVSPEVCISVKTLLSSIGHVSERDTADENEELGSTNRNYNAESLNLEYTDLDGEFTRDDTIKTLFEKIRLDSSIQRQIQETFDMIKDNQCG